MNTTPNSWKDIYGFMDPIDMDWMWNFLHENDIQSIVEIGVFAGRMTQVFAKYSKESGCLLTSIDPWLFGQTSKLPPAHKVKRLFVENMTELGVLDNIDWKCRKNSEVAGMFDKVDLVFVDGDHREPGLTSDLTLWTPKAKHLIGHDWNMKEVKDTVVKFGQANSLRPYKLEGSVNLWTFAPAEDIL